MLQLMRAHKLEEESLPAASVALCCSLYAYISWKKSPWEPKIDETYYFVGFSGLVNCTLYAETMFDVSMLKLGNCYPTKELAEKDVEKWKKFYKSDDVLEIN